MSKDDTTPRTRLGISDAMTPDLMRFSQFVAIIYAPRHSPRLQAKIKKRVGKRFGPWLVLSYEGTKERKNGEKVALWKAKCCQCGTIKVIDTYSFGNRGCGCLIKTVRGEKCKKKLKNDQVKEIKLMLREGHSQKTIALKFGIAQTNVSAIFRQAIWKHIEP